MATTSGLDTFSFCQEELKRTDPVAHFIALIAAEKNRPALMVLYAFLAELKRIPRQVSEPTMGEIRLQWWKDVIAGSATQASEGCGGENIGPLGAALRTIIRQYQLPVSALQSIIEARIFDLYNDPMPDLNTYETYAGETRSLPLALAAQILNDGTPVDGLSDLCGHAGMAIALSEHLTEWQKTTKERKLFLPLEFFASHGVHLTDIHARTNDGEVKAALMDLVQRGEEHLFKAEAFLKSLDGGSKGPLSPAFLGLAPTALRLKRLQKDPMTHHSIPNWRQYASIVRRAALG
ncbi:squalene/phytoene synthase family protein [uncultured Cohaesibacter sp.]|uniref:phytoene/squalene synthase family protein n=1 Tax=uncultured Cohaesibacter sp. TaxID=1002546 RepID=UPI0029C740C6|nr:squalene/phytoene synthase family protein [uncultured Cohaesibacter sp.]